MYVLPGLQHGDAVEAEPRRVLLLCAAGAVRPGRVL